MLASRPRLLSGHRRGAALVAAVAATALAGCSTDTTASKQTKTLTGTEGAVQAVIQDMATRAVNTDAAGICKNDLDASAQGVYAKFAGTCQKGLLKALDTADSLQMDVTSVKVTGASAVAQIDTPDDIGTRSVSLNKTADGKWKIVSFDAALSKTASTDATATPQSTLPLTSP
ncbi:MAG: hypothetical protein AAGC46_01990 [Solirubrobacteraceae bacterium]